MLVDFNTLPEESRVWIYQASRSFSDEEITEIESKLETFLSNWAAHGSDLQAAYLIKYKRFIVIALNQNLSSATGCSIDASVQFIQELEKQYNVDLLDKMNVSYKQGDFIAYKTLVDFKKMAQDYASQAYKYFRSAQADMEKEKQTGAASKASTHRKI